MRWRVAYLGGFESEFPKHFHLRWLAFFYQKALASNKNQSFKYTLWYCYYLYYAQRSEVVTTVNCKVQACLLGRCATVDRKPFEFCKSLWVAQTEHVKSQRLLRRLQPERCCNGVPSTAFKCIRRSRFDTAKCPGMKSKEKMQAF
jgi:hypothetical protein